MYVCIHNVVKYVEYVQSAYIIYHRHATETLTHIHTLKSEDPVQMYPSLSMRAAFLPFVEIAIWTQGGGGSFLHATTCSIMNTHNTSAYSGTSLTWTSEIRTLIVVPKYRIRMLTSPWNHDTSTKWTPEMVPRMSGLERFYCKGHDFWPLHVFILCAYAQ